MKKILFVEDEAALQEAVGISLEQKGYKVVRALDGEAGFRSAKTENPDLILLDLILPRKDGFEVLENLKKDQDTKDIPVIVLTNLEGMKDVEKAISLGAVSYLVKTDYDLKEMLKKIEEIIEK